MFPHGQAYSTRAMGLGKILRSVGRSVSFQGVAPRASDYHQKNLSGVAEGFPYHNIPTNSAEGAWLSNLTRTLARGWGARTQISSIDHGPLDVILNSSSCRYLFPFLIGARQRNWNVIIDVVEWYDYSHLPYGRFGPRALDCHISMKAIVPRASGVIAISTFLERYYLERGLPVVRIPQVVDLDDPTWNFAQPSSFDPGCINLVYAGFPGQKDLLGNVVQAVYQLVSEGLRIKLHLIGPKRSDMCHLLSVNQQLVESMDGTSLIFHGHVSPLVVPSLLAKADYSVLLRPNVRYANAGFPTKLTESFASGVPMVANLTGDIGLYLRDGETGWVVPNESVEALVATLRRVLRVPKDKYLSLRTAAIREAKSSFDYRNYVGALGDFFKNLPPAPTNSRGFR